MGERPITALSGGEAQRVALARALAPEPALLMLDEPFGSIDRVLREQLTADVAALLAELGQTALHVTHDQGEAFAIGHRVAVLRDGRIEQLGYPEDVWRRPANRFVAGFLGHRNLWSVEVDERGAVAVDGSVIGIREDVPAGRHEVVVPIEALIVDSAGALQATVVRSVFEEGRHRISARLSRHSRRPDDPRTDGPDPASGAAGRAPAGDEIVFFARAAMPAGARVRVGIDLQQMEVLASG